MASPAPTDPPSADPHAAVHTPLPAVARPREPSARWYRQIPPATLTLDCGGARHTIRWRKGRLVLLDHDVAAETAMMALGAERAACLTFLERWRGAFAAGGGAPGPARSVPRQGGGASRRTTAGGLRSATAAGGDLRTFGAELARVIELGRLVRAERRWADPDLPAHDRQRLVDAFLAGLRGAFSASLQPSAGVRGRQQLALHARPLPSGEESSAELTTTAGRIELEVQLPLGWVIEVGGRGLDAVDGRMVLAAVDADPQAAAVGVVGIVWDVHGPQRVGARLERWWMRRDEHGWAVVAGRRPVSRQRSLWWSTRQH